MARWPPLRFRQNSSTTRGTLWQSRYALSRIGRQIIGPDNSNQAGAKSDDARQAAPRAVASLMALARRHQGVGAKKLLIRLRIDVAAGNQMLAWFQAERIRSARDGVAISSWMRKRRSARVVAVGPDMQAALG